MKYFPILSIKLLINHQPVSIFFFNNALTKAKLWHSAEMSDQI